MTLGNALRRMLLSSIPSIAVTWVKIDGILHEFSPIPHIKEDVQEFILNVKQLNLSSSVAKTATLYLEAEGEGKIYARNLKVPPEIEIINPDVICALGTFAAQVLLKTGQSISSLRGIRRSCQSL